LNLNISLSSCSLIMKTVYLIILLALMILSVTSRSVYEGKQKATKAQSSHRKKDGDWYIYPGFLAHENINDKVCIRGKWPIRPKLIPKRLGIFLLRPGWDASPSQVCMVHLYCGSMYNHHFFSYVGFVSLSAIVLILPEEFETRQLFFHELNPKKQESYMFYSFL